MKQTGRFRFYFFLLSVIVLISSCTNELGVESFDFRRSVVVDALLTDEEKVHEIRLSYTSPVEEDTLLPLTSAQVWIEDDQQTVLSFREEELGVYRSESVFRGVPGRSYKLIFITEGGNRYESTSELLVKSPEIGRIRHELISRPIARSAEFEQGLQFFIDSEDESGNAQFFRYEWSSAKKTTVPHPEQFDVEITPLPPSDFDRVELTRLPLEKVPETCFDLEKSNSIILANTQSLSQSIALDVAVAFIPTGYFNLMERFSIEVTQYAISSKASNYYGIIRDFNDFNGSLFDTQQGSIVGNVRSVDNMDEDVLGYFEVSGVSKLRKFYNPEEFGKEFEDVFVRFSDVCSFEIIPDVIVNRFTASLDSFTITTLDLMDGFRIYDLAFTPSATSLSLASNFCVNCRNYGDLIPPPDYWID